MSHKIQTDSERVGRLKHARRLASEVGTWTERKLRVTYSQLELGKAYSGASGSIRDHIK